MLNRREFLQSIAGVAAFAAMPAVARVVLDDPEYYTVTLPTNENFPLGTTFSFIVDDSLKVQQVGESVQYDQYYNEWSSIKSQPYTVTDGNIELDPDMAGCLLASRKPLQFDANFVRTENNGNILENHGIANVMKADDNMWLLYGMGLTI